MRILKIFRSNSALISISTLLVTSLTLNHSALAIDTASKDESNYLHSFYNDEGALSFKLRGFYSIIDGKHQKMPAPYNNISNKAPGSLTTNGYGLEAATSFFFANNFAAELSMGIGHYKIKSTTISNIFDNYGTGQMSTTKNNPIYMALPAATLQYHIAMQGGIRPYLGAGYCGAYSFVNSNKFKIDPTHGPVLQVGVDLVAKDDSFINLDVKQYLMNAKISYREEFLNKQDPNRLKDQDVKGKIRFNPLVFSIGFGYNL